MPVDDLYVDGYIQSGTSDLYACGFTYNYKGYISFLMIMGLLLDTR